jgi:hypothetical protein
VAPCLFVNQSITRENESTDTNRIWINENYVYVDIKLRNGMGRKEGKKSK